MNNQQKKEIIHETARIHSKAPTLLEWDNLPELLNLGRQSKKHHRLCELYCNGDITEEQYDHRIDKIEQAINANINRLKQRTGENLQATFQHDPRGLTVDIFINNREQGTYRLYHLLGWE